MAWVRGRDGHILTVGREPFVADPRISSLYSVSGIVKIFIVIVLFAEKFLCQTCEDIVSSLLFG